MNKYSAAYAATKDHFALGAKQGAALDRSPCYTQIMDAAAAENWSTAGQLLMDAGIIGLAQLLGAVERNAAPAPARPVNPSGCIQGL